MTPHTGTQLQHAVAYGPMTDATELERRLAALVDAVAAAKGELRDLVHERNDVMRALNEDHGVHPKKLRELGGVNLQLAYRIVRGENR
jgi:hypothetical protein